MSDFTITVFDLQSTAAEAAMNVGAQAQDLIIETEVHGPSSATFNIPAGYGNPWQTQPRWLRRKYPVFISDKGYDSGVFWSGEIAGYDVDYNGKDGAVWAITLDGCATFTRKKAYANKDLQNTLSSTAMSTAITDLLAVGGTVTKVITPSGFTFQNGTAINFSGYLQDILNALAEMGNSSHIPYLWTLYPGASFNTLTFTARPRPTVPDYRAAVADSSQWGFRSLGGGGNRIRLWYNNDTEYVDCDNATSQAAESATSPYGINQVEESEAHFPWIPTGDVTDATQVGNTLVAFLSQQRMAPSKPFKFGGRRSQIVDITDGQEIAVPFHRIQAGQMMHLTDVPSGDGNTSAVAWNNLFLVAGTRYVENEQAVYIIPEGYADMVELAVAKVNSVLEGRRRL